MCWYVHRPQHQYQALSRRFPYPWGIRRDRRRLKSPLLSLSIVWLLGRLLWFRQRCRSHPDWTDTAKIMSVNMQMRHLSKNDWTVVSAVRNPMIPTSRPATLMTTDLGILPWTRSSLVVSMLAARTGWLAASTNGTNPSTPSSNSWLPNDCGKVLKNLPSLRWLVNESFVLI